MARKPQGNLTGLKPSQVKALSRLYFRVYPSSPGFTPEQVHELADITGQIKRQIGLLIDRRGHVLMVLVGDHEGILIPRLERLRQSSGRLSGIRLFHTHLGSSFLTREDLMDMVFLRLDSVSLLTFDHQGRPDKFQWAHMLPPNPRNDPYLIHDPVPWDRVDFDFQKNVESLEKELDRLGATLEVEAREGRGILVSVGTAIRKELERSLLELKDLAKTAGLDIAGSMIQRVPKVNPRYILGKGKLSELEVMALQHNASVIIFDQELTPTQLRNIASMTERKVLDRTQLILDIFAQHATSKGGKLQVEMAQLKYTLPRLIKQDRALSRLTGGIGGRGPGETKLELDRRKIRDRIKKIKDDLNSLRKHRQNTRSKRQQGDVPVISLVGYTNAGKSTLLNTLTHSEILAQDKLFATLDPTSRRLRFPKDKEIILTDTVGFIKDLPQDLREAFMATLEELSQADILVHVADVAHPEVEDQVQAVEKILGDLGLDQKRTVLALNKWDKLTQDQRNIVKNIFPAGIPITALDKSTLAPLVDVLDSHI
ncbi:MAG: GTPase HflX [Desulfonatronovibrio sp. MSAO_Bac4]|nr:MAG: GTPase HflX [Desulfonatronovibrio sp. MSAO_Bac4]